MARLNAETAETPVPDAAAAFGAQVGDTRQGRCGGPSKRCVAQRRAARAAIVRPTGRRSPVEDIKCLSSRAFAEQASNIARGTPVGPADLRFHTSGLPWRR